MLDHDLPLFSISEPKISDAFRIALGDTLGNIGPIHKGLLTKPAPVIHAGLRYKQSWTRDSAFNVWNGTPFLVPEISRDTLLSVLAQCGNEVRIGGELAQYWDAIIWSCGAWQYYLLTGDREFLALALDAVANSLAYSESLEFDAEINLFRGPACYGDGISAYPDIYVQGADGAGYIKRWPKNFPHLAAKHGFGLPMHALSTNCLFQHAYVLAGRMAAELDKPANPAWAAKADALRQAINCHFWMPERGHYRYLVDPFGGADVQEGLGHSFALLFNIADDAQAASVMDKQHITNWGIPCLWPQYERYTRRGEGIYGHHSGTVWPHIPPYWALGTLSRGRTDHFLKALTDMSTLANKYGLFMETHHPDTGVPYSGVQEGFESVSCHRQTWCATGYLRLIFFGLFGMQPRPEGMFFHPLLPAGASEMTLSPLVYRQMRLTLSVTGSGQNVRAFRVNGQPQERPLLDANRTGEQRIEIELAD